MNDPSPCRTIEGGSSLIVFVVDLADDLFDDILDRDQPVGAAVFVDHQRQMHPRRLHLRQQVDGGIDGGT